MKAVYNNSKFGKIVRIYSIFLMLFSPGLLFAQTNVPAFFSDHMVFQQNSKVPIWGKDLPGSKIKIEGSWGDEASTKADNKGEWRTEISTPEAGGPFILNIEGSQKIKIKDVLVGEVWLCSGQSNMQMPVRGNLNQPVVGSNEDILKSGNPELRVFQVKQNISLTPVDNVSGEWLSSEPSTVPGFSATAYYFGRLLQKTLGIPVGLIVSSFGGSSAEAWCDEKILSGFSLIKIPEEIPEKQKQQAPTGLYNAMLHPLIPYRIKGVIWYQGESNRGRAEEYKKLFPALIKGWRDKWQQGEFPFYFVQIAPFFYWNSGNAAFLREAQLQTMQTVQNTGMVVTLDLGDCECIHPSRKKQVGERLAFWALAKTYNVEGIFFSGPVYKSMEMIDDGKVNLFFEYAPLGMTSYGKELSGFQIAGEDEIFYPAQAMIITTENSGKMVPAVSVWSDAVKKPVAVRYAFENCIEGSLFNTAGLPASPFRTDKWGK